MEPAEAAGLAAALEEIPSAAWVVWADGRVALANAAARSEPGRVPEVAPPRLRACLAGGDDALHVTRVLAPGAPPHYLAVRRRGADDPAPRVAAAASRWGFTPGQSRVLALLALGQPNKAIASALGCAEATVEVHVTALLAKSGCASRCQLVSRLWSEPVGSRGRPPVP
jgi:DNA-binding CsgD family transcriptional regulator